MSISESWTEPEHWAWAQICEGRVADFDSRYGVKFGLGKPAAPENAVHDRKLGAKFLESVLLRKEICEKIPRQGIRIIGAHVAEPVDLSHATIERPISLQRTRFENRLDLSNTSIAGSLELSECVIVGDFSCLSANIKGAARFFNCRIDQSFVFARARIDQSLSLYESRIDGEMLMGRIRIGEDLTWNECKCFGFILLNESDIGGGIQVLATTFLNSVDAWSIKVSGNIYFADQVVLSQVNIQNATIGGSVSLSSAKLGSLDCGGATIGGELSLVSLGTKTEDDGRESYFPAMPQWSNGGRLVLTNAHVAVLPDLRVEEGWPDKGNLELRGLTYDRIGGVDERIMEFFYPRHGDWLKGYLRWLERDGSGSPQPYEQLANVLRDTGYPSKADDILYAGRKRAHWQALKEGAYLRWVGMSLLRWTIGFGLGRRYFWSTLWLLFFTLIGVYILLKSLPRELLELPVWLVSEKSGLFGTVSSVTTGSELIKKTFDLYDLTWASFDLLLPIVNLDRLHGELMTVQLLPWWAVYYFYFQKLVGWVLGSFLVAGLAGLTQKS